ncbi:MAG: hypothetical protein WBE13_23325, partial [Candidatus Acidiferrum sp.]
MAKGLPFFRFGQSSDVFDHSLGICAAEVSKGYCAKARLYVETENIAAVFCGTRASSFIHIRKEHVRNKVCYRHGGLHILSAGLYRREKIGRKPPNVFFVAVLVGILGQL